MTRWLFGAGVLALLLPVAIATPGAAQEECTCVGDGSVLSMIGPGAFTFQMGARARLGIAFSTRGQEGYRDVGAVITSVYEESPAEAAGLEVGDVVVAVDGHELMERLEARLEHGIDEDGSAPVQRLMALARDWDAGEAVQLTVLRDGDETNVEVVPEATSSMEPLRRYLGEVRGSLGRVVPEQLLRGRGMRGSLRTTTPRVSVWTGDGDGFGFGRWGGAAYGLELTELNPQLASYFGTDVGVLVLDVSEDSTLGVEPGDVIVGIGDRDIEIPRDVRRILNSYDDDEEVRIEIRRHGNAQTVTGTTG